MDLGATICIPQNPRCGLCPVKDFCEAHRLGIQNQLPAKALKKAKPQRIGRAYWLENSKGQVLLERRGEKRMLGGMTGLPTTDWDNKAGEDMLAQPAESLRYVADIYHSFTHFDLKLEIWRGVSAEKKDNQFFSKKADVKKAGLPTVFLKVAKVMLAHDK